MVLSKGDIKYIFKNQTAELENESLMHIVR